MLQSFHQSGEQFEILFNKDKYTRCRRAEEPSSTTTRRGRQRRHELEGDRPQLADYRELKKDGVNFYKTPDAILRAQLDAWDKVIEEGRRETRCSRRCSTRSGLRQRDPLAERLHGRPQDGLQPLLRQEVRSLAVRPRAGNGRGDIRRQFCPFRVPCLREPHERQLCSRSTAFHLVGQTVPGHRHADRADRGIGFFALRAEQPATLDAERQNMLYGTLFMMAAPTRWRRTATCAATCSTASSMPRTPGRARPAAVHRVLPARHRALTWAGWNYANEALAIREQTFNATPLPVYPFKFVIPIAGAILLLQGIGRDRALHQCLRDGDWPSRERTWKRSTSTSSRRWCT